MIAYLWHRHALRHTQTVGDKIHASPGGHNGVLLHCRCGWTFGIWTD